VNHPERITPELSRRIDEWVAQQLAQPWPLTSSQLDQLRRSLAPQEAGR